MTKEELYEFLTTELEAFQENKSKIEEIPEDIVDGIPNLEFLFRMDLISDFIREMIRYFEEEEENK